MIFDPNFGNEVALWLVHDSWTPDSAFALMSCIDPNSGGLRRVSMGISPLCSDIFLWGDEEGRRAKKHYDHLWNIWNSGVWIGRHDESQEVFPPSYFLAWAKEKKIVIPWLQWAIDNGLVPADSGEAVATNHATAVNPLAINGGTFSRLQRAIDSFPIKYPDYKTKQIKLDDDIRKWLEETGLGRTDAERRVFGAILTEHFGIR